MSARYPPLTLKQVKKILTNLGFKPQKQRSGTSHQQWKLQINGTLYKVTVDPPRAPFHRNLLRFMYQQAGVSKKEFYAALTTKGHPRQR